MKLFLFLLIEDGSKTSLQINMPKLPAHFTGTGDLFAALLLAWLHYHSDNIKLACEKTVSTMQDVLKRTLAKAKGKHFKLYYIWSETLARF